MRNWPYLVLLALVIGAPPMAAANLTPDDFAYGFKLAVPAGTPVAATSLPEPVYKHAFRSDLGDIRVFNAAGEPVPHMLRQAQSQAADAPWRQLDFFPLPDEVKAGNPGYRIHVRTGPDGALIRVDPQAEPVSGRAARTFLIDLSRVGRSLAELRLDWTSATVDLMATLAVDASDDLVNWTTPPSRSVISDIRFGGRRLRNDSISLTPAGKRYLRLRQVDGGPAVPLTRIDGRPQPEGRNPVRTYLRIDGQRLADAPGVFEYRYGGAFPVDRVNLLFDQPNSMADAMLESRSNPRETWTRRSTGLFYRIDLEGTRLTSGPQAVAVSPDRQWRLTVDASDSTVGRSVPRLEIGYRPHDLFFIARGDGPFILAFGSSRAEPLNVNVAALFDGISQHRENGFQQWVIPQGESFVLGGDQRLASPPLPLPTRRIVLWSIMLAGVLVVAGMAWRLARRMRC